jgi:hypothetical protein
MGPLTLRAVECKSKGLIPYLKILPEGRRLEAEDSQREIPLVGAALAVMKLPPQGFPRHRNKGSGLTATVKKYLPDQKRQGYLKRRYRRLD